MTDPRPSIRSVLFVCTGNSCRSVMAEGFLKERLVSLKKADIEVHSAGVRALGGMSPTEETVEVMREEGIDISGIRSKNVTVDMIKSSDLILVMEPLHKDEILNVVPAAAKKTYLLKEYGNSSKIDSGSFSVQDPIGKPMEYYRACRDEIKKETERIVKGL